MVTGRKARGPQVAGGNRNKLQVSDFFFSPRYTKLKEVSFNSVLTTWPHLVLPWANQCIFLMEIFFLSYVNETIYLLWNLPFFKMVPPKTNFFLFSNLGLIMTQQTSIPVNCFMAGDDTPPDILSQKCIVWERGLVKLPQPWGVSYLINSFLDLVWSLDQEDHLEKEMATRSSILAWRIPWMEEPGGLQSTGSQRVGPEWATSL